MFEIMSDLDSNQILYMESKTCSVCLKNKPVSEFSWKNKIKGYKQSKCKDCMKIYKKDRYNNNKSEIVAKVHEHNKKKVQQHREKLYELLLDSDGCVDCGETDPIVLQFDHIRDKENNISYMIRCAYSWNRILQEIEKCEIRCANCHLRKTAKDQNWFKLQVTICAFSSVGRATDF